MPLAAFGAETFSELCWRVRVQAHLQLVVIEEPQEAPAPMGFDFQAIRPPPRRSPQTDLAVFVAFPVKCAYHSPPWGPSDFSSDPTQARFALRNSRQMTPRFCGKGRPGMRPERPAGPAMDQEAASQAEYYPAPGPAPKRSYDLVSGNRRTGSAIIRVAANWWKFPRQPRPAGRVCRER